MNKFLKGGTQLDEFLVEKTVCDNWVIGAMISPLVSINIFHSLLLISVKNWRSKSLFCIVGLT